MKFSLFFRFICFVVSLVSVVPITAASSQEAILDAWAAALGGKEKLRSISSTYSSSNIATGELSGVVENWSTSTGKFKENALLGSVYRTITVYDTEQRSGWVADSSGAIRRLEGTDLQNQITAAYFSSFSLFIPGRLPGKVTYEGEDATKHFDVVRVYPEGGRSVTVYLDKATHLPAKQEQQEDDGLLTILFSDYRDVSGIRVPFQFRQTTGNPDTDVLVVLQEIRWNVPIDPKIFSRPAVSPLETSP